VPVVRLAVAACVLLVVAACASPRTAGEARQSLSAPTPSAAAERADYLSKGGMTLSIRDDLTLSVSAPTSFTPTEEAYPQAVRAVAFELVLDNRGDAVYRPAQLSFVATVDGVAADQVIDSTQGYSGVTGTADEVLPSQTLRFSVAFGVPDRPCVVRVAVRPDSSSGNAIPIFDGTV
jgi:hypothetical protein